MAANTQGFVGGASQGAGLGSSFGPWGALIGAGIGGAVGDWESSNRPKYQINPEYDENRALAQGAAFGQNNAVTQGLKQADADMAETGNQAQQVSSSTGQILNVLKSANQTKMNSQRQLTGLGAQFNNQGRQELMGANTALAEEKDKAWNYNQNMPYQNAMSNTNSGIAAGATNYWKRMDMLSAMKLLGNRNSPYATSSSTPQFSAGSPSDGSEEGTGWATNSGLSDDSGL